MERLGQGTGQLQACTDLAPLHGIPVVIKDLIEVEGAPTGYGPKVLVPQIARRDAALFTRLRGEGEVALALACLAGQPIPLAQPELRGLRLGVPACQGSPHRSAMR